MQAQSLGLSLVPKLKLEHLQLTSFSKMRVDLAAEVRVKCVCKHSLTIHWFAIAVE